MMDHNIDSRLTVHQDKTINAVEQAREEEIDLTLFIGISNEH